MRVVDAGVVVELLCGNLDPSGSAMKNWRRRTRSIARSSMCCGDWSAVER